MDSVKLPAFPPIENAKRMVDAEPGADLHSTAVWASQLDISHAVPILSTTLFCQLPNAFPATVRRPEPVDGTFAGKPFPLPTKTPTGPSKDTLCVRDPTSNPAVTRTLCVA
eukprot:3549142-Rhodomonas_salina.1